MELCGLGRLMRPLWVPYRLFALGTATAPPA